MNCTAKVRNRMTKNRRKNPGLVCCLAAIVLIVGCRSEERFYREISTSRAEAYNLWKSREELAERSQSHITGKLSLADALKLSLLNNKTLQRIVLEKEIARGEVVKSQSAILPSVDLNASYIRLEEVGSFGSIQIGDVHNYSADLTVTQPFFAGGSIPARLNTAKLTKLFSDQTVRAAIQDVIFETARDYYDVLLNQQLYEITVDAVRSAKASLDAVEQKRAAGVASDFDVLRAQVELSNFKAEEITNRNAISLSKVELLRIIGVSQASEVTLSDELTYAPYSVSFDEAVRTAYQNRPDLYQDQIGIKSQQEALKIAQSKYWPTISGYYTNEWARPDPKSSTIDWGREWQAGVIATLPVFDGFGREGGIIQEKARLRQAHIALVETEETVLSALRAVILSIEDTAEFVDSQRLNLQRAEEGLRLAEVGFREGINTQVEVLDARAALTKARSLYYQAIHSHTVASLTLKHAMGILSTPQAVSAKEPARPKSSDEPDLVTNRKQP
jgi:outer membrane protein